MCRFPVPLAPQIGKLLFADPSSISAFARFDMAVYSPPTHNDCLNMDPGLIFNNLMERLRLLPNPDPRDRGHPQADFHHVVSGMDAGYYSYLMYVDISASAHHSAFFSINIRQ